MEVIPAIDLLGGKCVRLLKGDFTQVTEYADDPIPLARQFIADGAARIHVVDLDAAQDAKRDNHEAVEQLVRSTGAAVQVAGGIRSEKQVETWFERGAGYVVIGTLAAEKPAEVGRLADRWPNRIYVALDMRGDHVSTHGWGRSEATTLVEMLDLLQPTPLAGLVYTDVERDGTLAGPDIEGLRQLARQSAHPVILSGGVSSVDDLRQARLAGASGAIVGRALYEGRIDLQQAIAELAGAEAE